MKRIGIMGGTFDPIHFGHLLIAEQAYEQYKLDQVMFLPSGDPPHKEGKAVTPAKHRLQMVELAIQDNLHFFCSSLEINREGYSYTAKTLMELTEQNLDTAYYFIVGADSLDYMECWYQPEEIFKRAVILAVSRNTVSDKEMAEKTKELRERFQADIRPVAMPLLEISSTEIRNKCAQGNSVRYMTPETVCAYIKEHQLYQK